MENREKTIEVFIDGPNILREGYKLSAINKILEEEGKAVIKKVYLTRFSGEKLIEAVAIAGYEPIICITDDTDTKLIIDASEFIRNNDRYKFDIFALGSGDFDFFPLLCLAKDKGLETLVFSLKNQSGSEAIKNFADIYRALE